MCIRHRDRGYIDFLGEKMMPFHPIVVDSVGFDTSAPITTVCFHYSRAWPQRLNFSGAAGRQYRGEIGELTDICFAAKMPSVQEQMQYAIYLEISIM